jgi:RimJ/RimL family protein N-acetyltransferase
VNPDAGIVALRDIVDDDLPLIFEQQRDPAYDHMAAFTHKDPSDRAAFDAHWRKIRGDPAIVIRTILHEGRVVGTVASWVQSGERQVTYGLAREHWGKGLATRALTEFLRLVTERPLFASAAADNAGSRRVLEKCGFRVVGSATGFANARGREIEEVMFRLDGPGGRASVTGP